MNASSTVDQVTTVPLSEFVDNRHFTGIIENPRTRLARNDSFFVYSETRSPDRNDSKTYWSADENCPE